MNTLAVILARAGSVGLRNKHLLPVMGRPVISYTFDHARAAGRLTRTVVSSDCGEIRRLAGLAKFETVLRPPALATADASVQDVMLHALRTVEGRSDFRADALVVLYGNVPVRGAGVIDRALALLQETGCDSVRTFCPVGKWHPAWMAKLERPAGSTAPPGAGTPAPGFRVQPLLPGSTHRRQDLAPLFLHDGAAVAVSRASMLRGQTHPCDPHAFFGSDRRAVETAVGETVEIDHLRDLYWAEAVLREKEQAPRLSA